MSFRTYKSWSEFSADLGPELEPEVELVTAQMQYAYVKGYILAMQDVLKDIEEWESGDEEEMEYHRALDNVRSSVNESLSEAKEMLERLE